jgi:hypothetical protein
MIWKDGEKQKLHEHPAPLADREGHATLQKDHRSKTLDHGKRLYGEY